MLRTKQTHTYTYYRFIESHCTHNTTARQLHYRFQYINSNYTSPFFLTFKNCIKDTNLQGTLRSYDPITQMYIFCPLNKLINLDKSLAMIIPHEFLQPFEVPIEEFTYNTRYNQKIYNLIENTPYEQSPNTEDRNTIEALQLLWPLLQTRNIIRLLN